jgi:ligand-binding sensor domain-containing protein
MFSNELGKYFMFWRFVLILMVNFVLVDTAIGLTISPDNPVVVVGERITLTANDAVGNVRWQAFDGAIIGSGNEVTYIAPSKVGLDSVTAKDDDSSQIVNIVVNLLPTEIKPENAQWEIFTNRSSIQTLLLSEDKKTLWVGTNGGLEKRDAETGQLIKLFTKLDGLPSSEIHSLSRDVKDANRIWIVTEKGGVYFDLDKEIISLDENRYGFPDISKRNYLSEPIYLKDQENGIWIAGFDFYID